MLAWILTKLPFLLRLAPALSFLRGHMKLLVALVPLAMGAWIWWQGRTIDGLEADLAAAQTRAQALEDANQTNQNAIGHLKRANKDLADAIRAQTAASAGVYATLRENLMRREAKVRNRLSGVLKELEELKHESPKCEAFASTDVGAMCPDLVDRLREHARGARPD